MRKYLGLLLLMISLASCTVEKVNLSPLSNNFSNFSATSSFSDGYYKSMEAVNYASELTNVISEFPVFSNAKLNSEVYKLKLSITDYVYAIKQENSLERSNAYKKYTDSYKNIQTLKTQLSRDELELLNRFLAKIKTNISLIDSINFSESK